MRKESDDKKNLTLNDLNLSVDEKSWLINIPLDGCDAKERSLEEEAKILASLLSEAHNTFGAKCPYDASVGIWWVNVSNFMESIITYSHNGRQNWWSKVAVGQGGIMNEKSSPVI